MLWSWIVDQIPLWAYVVVAVLVAGTLFYFFSPILVPLWNMTPRPVKYAIGVMMAIASAFVYGRNKGSSDAKEMERRRAADAIKTRAKIDEEVHNRSDTDLDKSASKWMRD